ncbi:MAG: cytochrome c oxidase subunit II [Planctomycetota bacterium]|nr:MAG: cytochrome c oxidase subunit II [Planctomycetota bacterium]
MGWWFPTDAYSTLGQQIDDLFYLILTIVGVVFIGTHIALGYTLWKGSQDPNRRSWFTHGSHTLEVIWTIVPAGILLFIALYQMDVWRMYRVQSAFPEDLLEVAEVTARQFEWRIRYPAPGRPLQLKPQKGDVYAVNDLHVPVNRPVLIQLRTMDVQHSFFVPSLRVKQDALPGQVIPVWFEVTKPGIYDLTCAELCGWGHYKMRGRVVAEAEEDFRAYLQRLAAEQAYDGVTPIETALSHAEKRQNEE